jgi:hypothetical protein
MKSDFSVIKYLLFFIFLSTSIEANATSDVEKLVTGCNELMGMYKNRYEKRLLASQMASSSDSLLAGFCLGATKVYINTRYSSCDHADWYKLAESVAGMWSLKENSGSVYSVLKRACDG